MEQKRDSVIKKVLGMIMGFMILITIVYGYIFYKEYKEKKEYSSGNMIVTVNEISKITEDNGTNKAQKELDSLENMIRESDTEVNDKALRYIELSYVAMMSFLCIIFIYVYDVILKPFRKMEAFAGEIAKGNFEVEMKYEHKNMFGAFTWAFDHMKQEIVKARMCEKEAIENNKTVIATLSHDIKTPIASIRTYTEGLEAGMDTTLERRDRYLKVIISKCDEVTKLTNDLFVHSISDLNKLQINLEKVYIDEVIIKSVDEMKADYDDIDCDYQSLGRAKVMGDPLRIEQVIENIINNARKYAKDGPIHIYTEIKQGDMTEAGVYRQLYIIRIRDSGHGISPEDMPFVMEKFYRGKNRGNEKGAGLGLYIVNYIMKQMNGEVVLNNNSNGLEVELIMDIYEE